MRFRRSNQVPPQRSTTIENTFCFSDENDTGYGAASPDYTNSCSVGYDNSSYGASDNKNGYFEVGTKSVTPTTDENVLPVSSKASIISGNSKQKVLSPNANIYNTGGSANSRNKMYSTYTILIALYASLDRCATLVHFI